MHAVMVDDEAPEDSWKSSCRRLPHELISCSLLGSAGNKARIAEILRCFEEFTSDDSSETILFRADSFLNHEGLTLQAGPTTFV